MTIDATTEWLLAGDPAIAWQTLRDLVGADADEQDALRARIPHEGWGAELLGRQLPSGDWGGDPDDAWRYNLTTMELLRVLECDPADPIIRSHIETTRDRVHWPEWFGSPSYFDGEEEACINGQVLAQGASFGVLSSGLVTRLLDEQLDDGGWNCEAPHSTRSSFDSTICVLEGLLAYERAAGPSALGAAARARGEDYLLQRGLLRRASTGELIAERYLHFGWPSRWHYDVLRALDYFRAAGRPRDQRLEEALDAVRAQRRPNGRWITETPPLDISIALLEEPGSDSRMITLRARRVLQHFGIA